MVKNFTAWLSFLIIFLISIGVNACPKENSFLQWKALLNYNGASKDLTKTMHCLKGKAYPHDIEECGVSSFGNAIDFEQVKSCMLSDSPQRAVPIGVSNKKDSNAIALKIECNDRYVLIIFKERGGHFFVDGINFLLD